SIAFAARYPERVEKLILASAVSEEWLDKNGQVYKTAKRLFHPNTAGMVWRLIRFFSGLFPQMTARNFYTQFSKNKPHRLAREDINELLAAFKYYHSKSGFMCDIEHEIEPGVLAAIQCPTLIIHSKNDNSVPFEHAEYAKRMIKHSELLVLENEWGHLFWIGSDSIEPVRKTMEFIEHHRF
ncbi:MAG: alpha/beta fold hydrolase, partial [Mariniphaga sp.]